MILAWEPISAAVAPYLGKYIAERVGKIADHTFGSALERIASDKTALKANELFVARFSEELDRSIDIPTLQAEPYSEDLKRFLVNPSVQDIVIAPLDGTSDLNWQLLDGIWNESELMALPEDFDWATLAKVYRKTLVRLSLTDSSLRPAFVALQTALIAESSAVIARSVERLAGPERALDLQRYSKSIKQAFAHLRLGSLDADWTKYGIRLETVDDRGPPLRHYFFAMIAPRLLRI